MLLAGATFVFTAHALVATLRTANHQKEAIILARPDGKSGGNSNTAPLQPMSGAAKSHDGGATTTSAATKIPPPPRVFVSKDGRPRPILVFGSHHTGTSIVTKLIAEMGADAGEQRDLVMLEGNPLKYNELRMAVDADKRFMKS